MHSLSLAKARELSPVQWGTPSLTSLQTLGYPAQYVSGAKPDIDADPDVESLLHQYFGVVIVSVIISVVVFADVIINVKVGKCKDEDKG